MVEPKSILILLTTEFYVVNVSKKQQHSFTINNYLSM